MATFRFAGTLVVVEQGDITNQSVDAVVNAANSRLAGGGGVDGAIHRAAGPAMRVELDAIVRQRGGCPTGQAVATSAGSMACRHIIHAVGPVFRDEAANECDELLASAYRSSLAVAKALDLRSIAFPAISTGVYGFPIRRATPIVLRTVREFVDAEPFDEVRFVLFSRPDYDVYLAELEQFAR